MFFFHVHLSLKRVETSWKTHTYALCKLCSQAPRRGILSGLYLDHEMSRAWRRLEISQVTFSHRILYHKMHENIHIVCIYLKEHSEDGKTKC